MLSPEEQSAVEAEVAQMREKAVAGYANADSIEGWSGQYVTLEVSGVTVDMGMSEQRVAGEVVLSKESALAAMWSLGKSLGEPEQTEQFLKSVFGWEG